MTCWIKVAVKTIVLLGFALALNGANGRVAARHDASSPSTPPLRQAASAHTAVGISATLATATYPVTVAPEIGTNDFRISTQATPGGITVTNAAYNSTTEQYLVVWEGVSGADANGDFKAKIYGQLIDARTGAEVGTNDFVVAAIGPDSDGGQDASAPNVVYNATLNEFLIVFIGDDKPETANPNPPPATLVFDTNEVYAQRVAANGTLLGGQLRVSDMGALDTNGNYDAFAPDVVWNSTDNQYLVVWHSDDDSNGLVNSELEIFGQLLGYSGGNLVELGTNDFQISMMGGANGTTAFDAREPAVTWNSTNNDYLVVWQADDNTGGRVDNRFIIFGRRYGSNGTALDASFFQISNIGAVSDTSVETFSPDVTYNSTSNEYLVVWEGDGANSTAGSANDFEIWAQRLNGATGAASGSNVQLSNMGTAGSSNFTAQTAAVTYNPNNQEYLVVWRGDTNTGGLVDDEYEIFGLRLSQTLMTIEGVLRLSDMGTNGQPNPGLQPPAVAYSNRSVNDYLVVWAGENPGVTAAGEGEVWGQFVATNANLQITKTRNSSATPAPGEAVQYTITYSNSGPDTVFDIVLTDLIPAAVTGTSFMTSGVTGAAPVLRMGTTYIWDVAQLASGQGGTITINGTVGAAVGDGMLVGNTASIATTTVISDPNSSNNSQTVNFTVDAGPSLTINQAMGQADPANSSPINFTVVFSETVNDFATGDVTLSGTAGATTAMVSGSGTTYNVAVSGMTTSGTVIATIAAGVATGAGGKANTASTSTDNTVTYDPNAPTVLSSNRANSNPTNAASVSFTVTFSESVTGVDTNDFALTTTGLTGAAITNVSGGNNVYTVTVSTGSGNGTLRLDVSDNDSIQDAVGNPLGGAGAGNGNFTTGQNYDVDKAAPTVQSSNRADANPTSASSVNFTVTFSENVTGVDTGDFSLTTAGLSGAMISSISGGNNVYMVTVSTGSGNGTLRLDVVDNDSILDAAGNLLGGTGAGNGNFTTGQVYDVLLNCAANLSKLSESFAANGGSGSVMVTIPAGCMWTAVSNNPSFITVNAPTGTHTGNGTVTYTVASHSSTNARSGTITIASQTFTVLQGAAFLDVPNNHPLYNEIGKLSARGVTLGCGGGNFCPDNNVTREQIAALLLRAKEGGAYVPPPATGTVFADVSAGNPFAAFIEELYNRGITLGCAAGPLRYCPTDPVRRDQAAVFILRTKEGAGYMPPPATGTIFADVPANMLFANFIEDLYTKGITAGCAVGPLRYCPVLPVTRGQMAAFLVRAFEL
jgi:hypothetical protein